jgi:MarR family transcriptional regulator, negative regulator of the multidrug operon emrRAB
MDTEAPAPGTLQQRAEQVESVISGLAALSAELPVVETTILRLLVMLGHDLSALLEQCLGPYGLNETDYRTLLTLYSRPGGVAYPGELGTSVARSPANMTRIADALYRRGLITRVASERDRRRTILRLSASGEALVRELLPEAARRTTAIFEGIPESARGQLLEQLRVLIGTVDCYARQRQAVVQPDSSSASASAAAVQSPHAVPDDG